MTGMKYRLHIRRMHEPGIYWTWNPRTKSPEQKLVDYASRDHLDSIDAAQGITIGEDIYWRMWHVFGVVIVACWPASSRRST